MPKIGDTIKVRCYDNSCNTKYYIRVTNIVGHSDFPIKTSDSCPRCRGDYSYDTSYIIKESNSILSKSPMKKLSLIAKQLLDKDLADLVKAGILNSELEVEDTAFIMAFIVSQHKKELGEEARRILKERKEDKKSKED